ncbi:MAG: YraN family protein [Actinomycetota bacterium]
MALHQRASELGLRGEEFTVQHLSQHGFRIIDRNWRVKDGEIDIVALSPENEIVFVEVKSRSSAAFGEPLESISAEKLHRLQRLALAWLAMHQRLGHPYRVDVAGVLAGRSGELSIDYRKGIL